MVTTGGMTNRLDRLEAAGLISREADPSDRRGKLIALTGEGRALVDAAAEGSPEERRRILATLPSADREKLAGLLRRLLLALDS